MSKEKIISIQEYKDRPCSCKKGNLLLVEYIDEKGRYRTTDHLCKKCVLLDNLKKI